MKSFLSLIVCAFFVLALASTAQSKDAQANGDFDFGAEGVTGSIVFEADGDDTGVTGQMTLNATVVVGIEDGEATTTTDVTIAVQFDCMLVNDNQAALSGVVTSSNIPADYPVGKPVTLFVVDKVEGINPIVDAFAWGVYKPNFKNLNAKDYDFCPTYYPNNDPEDLGDCDGPCPQPPPPGCFNDGTVVDDIVVPGASMTWLGKDSELCYTLPPGQSNIDDDNPVPNPVFPCNPDPNPFAAGIPNIPTAVSCETFPLSAYPLNFVDGNKIQVKNHP